MAAFLGLLLILLGVFVPILGNRPAAQGRETVAIAMPPQPIDPYTWVKSEDYPREAMANGWSGRTEVRLHVNAEGGVVSCVMTESSNHAVLDFAACDVLLRRGRFTPARDEHGAAVGSEFTTHIAWKIPEGGHEDLPISY